MKAWKGFLLNSKVILSLVGATAIVATTAVIVFNDGAKKQEDITTTMEKYMKENELKFNDEDTVLVSTLEAAGYKIDIETECLNDSYIQVNVDENGKYSFELIKICESNDVTIKLNGDANITLEFGKEYIELGATATVDGHDVSSALKTTDNINYEKLGTYTVTYSIIRNGEESKASRTVEIVDKTAPVLTLKNGYTLSVILGDKYAESGYRAVDAYDGEVTNDVKVEGKVDTDKLGSYILTYTVSDNSGNKKSVKRTVNVVEAAYPVINLKGYGVEYVNYPENYKEKGYIATDKQNGIISDKVQVIGKVDTTKLGTYTLTYRVTNTYGKTSEIKRIVEVRDITKPVISLIGGNGITLEYGERLDTTKYTYSANDNYDGNVSSKVKVDYSVIKYDLLGDYTLVYTVSDTTGNETVLTRKVSIVDTTKPTIELKGNADITIEVGSTYVDAGAIYKDNYDLEKTIAFTSSNLNTNIVNKDGYTITYTAKDTSSNEAEVVTRTVFVVDTTKPTIQIDEKIVNVYENDLIEVMNGIKAEDNYDDNDAITAKITSSVDDLIDENGKISFAEEGTYTITYSVTDENGNTTSEIKTVVVHDSSKPYLEITSDDYTLEVCGEDEDCNYKLVTEVCPKNDDTCVFNALNTKINDYYKGFKYSLNKNDNVNINMINAKYDIDGNITLYDNDSEYYNIIYNVTNDSDQIVATAKVKVIIVDTTKPTIEIGRLVILIDQNHKLDVQDIFNGVKVSDNYEGVICIDLECLNILDINLGSIDTKKPGTYSITYSYTDGSGNTGTATRTIIVKDTERPVISVVQGTPSSVMIETTGYFDPKDGIIVTDNYDNNIESKLAITGMPEKVDGRYPVGVYTIKYNVSDKNDNSAAELIRTLTIIDTLEDSTDNAINKIENAFNSYDKNDYSPADLPEGYAENYSKIEKIYNDALTMIDGIKEAAKDGLNSPEIIVALENIVENALEDMEVIQTYAESLQAAITNKINGVPSPAELEEGDAYTAITLSEYQTLLATELAKINAIKFIEDVTAYSYADIEASIDALETETELADAKETLINSLYAKYLLEDAELEYTTRSWTTFKAAMDADIIAINNATKISDITNVELTANETELVTLVQRLENIIQYKLDKLIALEDLDINLSEYTTASQNAYEKSYNEELDYINNTLAKTDIATAKAYKVKTTEAILEKEADLDAAKADKIASITAPANAKELYTDYSWGLYEDAVEVEKDIIEAFEFINDVEDYSIDIDMNVLETKAAFEAAVDAKMDILFGEYEETDYTYRSWAEFEVAMANERTILEGLYIIAAVNAYSETNLTINPAEILVTIERRLGEIVDYKLDKLDSLNEALDKADYTNASIEDYNAELVVIRAAINDLLNTNIGTAKKYKVVLPTELLETAAELQAAKELKLAEVPTTEDLEESDYTSASWLEYTTAIAADNKAINEATTSRTVNGYDITANTDMLIKAVYGTFTGTNKVEVETNVKIETVNTFSPGNIQGTNFNYTAGKDAYGKKVNVKIEVEGNENNNLQILAQDTKGNWSDLASTGTWGKLGGLLICEEFTSLNALVYFVAPNAGTYTVTYSIVEEGNGNVLATLTQEVKVVTNYGTFTGTDKVEVETNAKVESVNTFNPGSIQGTNFNYTAGKDAYGKYVNVKVEVEGNENNDLQILAQDTKGKWSDLATTGTWGKLGGLLICDEFTSLNALVYFIAPNAGTYTVTYSIVEEGNGNVLATLTQEVKVSQEDSLDLEEFTDESAQSYMEALAFGSNEDIIVAKAQLEFK